MSTVTVRRLDELDDVEDGLRRYYTADAAAFGGPFDAAQLEAKRGLIRPDRFYLAELDGVTAGGTGSFPLELTLPGGARVATAAVSDVGVVPSHRRRGVVSALIARQLADAAERGEVLAVIHASEGGIYQRFGFGPATRWRQLLAAARRVEFRDDWPDPGGSLQVLALHDAGEPCRSVHDRARRAAPGGLSRNDAWWDVVLGTTVTYIGGSDRRLVMVHRDDDGEPDGYAIYEVHEDWSRGQANHRLDVWELVGTSTGVELALWRAVLSHDLVATVRGPIAVDHALWDVVLDARQVGIVWDQDLLWARVLDVPTVLSARTYRGSGRLVLEVDDPLMDSVGGRFALELDEGAATCTSVDEPADLTLSVADLGAVCLGGGSLRRLVRAGRVQVHTEGAAATADGWLSVDPLPWCWVRF